MNDKKPETCKICATAFDERLHQDCGGDCLLCMAESGDTDCRDEAFRFLLESHVEGPPAAKFKHGDLVRKIKGSQWKGRVVGTYSTELTPEGYAVESDTEKGSVQIYPAAALEMAKQDEQPVPGVAGLVEALEACRDELMWMIERHNQQDQSDGSWLYDYQTVVEADAALAAHRKQGGGA